MPPKSTKKNVKRARPQRAQAPSAATRQDVTSEYGASHPYEPGTSSSSQQTTESFQSLRVSVKQKLPPKPPPSDDGSLPIIKLVSNHYPMNVPDIIVYHYDVEINRLTQWKEGAQSEPLPESSSAATALQEGMSEEVTESTSAVPSMEATGEDVETVEQRGKAKKSKYACYNTKINRKVLQNAVDDDPELSVTRYVYDGRKNMYTLNTLQKNVSTIILFTDELDRECRFEVKIRPVEKENQRDNSISLEPLRQLMERRCSFIPQDAIMVLETILRNKPVNVHVPIGRSLFPVEGASEELPGGRILKKGYHQSMLLTDSGAVVNFDVAATTFYQPGSVIEFLRQLIEMMAKEEKRRRVVPLESIPMLTPGQKARLDKELHGCRIYANHFTPHRKYKVHGISERSADEEVFQIDNRSISITEYFRETYNINLKFGRFPCLKIHKIKKIYLPLEVCEIPEGEHCLGKPNKLQTSELIQQTALPPLQRFCEIQKTVDMTIKCFGNDLSYFGITIDKNPMEVEGRLLNSPELCYRDNKKTQPKDGKWNLVRNKVLHGVKVKNWAILAASSNIRQEVEKFAEELVSTAAKFGLAMNPVGTIRIVDARQISNVHNSLKELQKFKGIELVVVVLRSKNDENYCRIKYMAEKELGLITQCLSGEKLYGSKWNEQFLANLCLKINGKLGGINSTLKMPEIMGGSTVVIGADCNHPSPKDEVKYSVAATVCNLDECMGQFATACTIQPREKNKRIELMKKLKYMVVDLLKHYHVKNKRHPDKIIFFRDGVSEGEYERVFDEEVPQVQKACEEVIHGKKPKITFLIVNKRHHTRLKVEDPKDGVKPQGNVPPGTKVDKGITHIKNFDFYLCSHNGIKGTSRPAHYTVIYDENDFGSINNKPQLEELCYYLCHTSSRCTRSVSIPAPVDYAHHAAYRAKQYLLAAPDADRLASEWSEGVKVATEICDRMYFI